MAETPSLQPNDAPSSSRRAVFDLTCNSKSFDKKGSKQQEGAQEISNSLNVATTVKLPVTQRHPGAKRVSSIVFGILCFVMGVYGRDVIEHTGQVVSQIEVSTIVEAIEESAIFSKLFAAARSTTAQFNVTTACALPQNATLPWCVDRALAIQGTWKNVTQGSEPPMAFHLFKPSPFRAAAASQ